ncbi:MAG: hypothetical protein E4G91_01325 [Candidatus Zixiibacteriota bacterium]|nr:MAG: hypothetical protein E4G91_01325 [candidate division Zixibacteria bacterium]
MDLRKEYGFTDKTLETEGVDVKISSGAIVTVARTNNPKFKNYLRQLLKPYERQMQRKRMDDELLEDLTLKAISKYVLLGWKGIELDGKPVKYSPEKAYELMKEFEDFAEDVLDAASMRETFRAEIVEENTKNL